VLSFGPEKILVVLVLAMILLGPDKLPSMARQLGAAVRAFREFQHKVETEVRNTVPDLPSSADIARFTRSPGAFLNSLAEMDLGQDPVPDPGAATPTEDDAWPSDPGAPGATARVDDQADGSAPGGAESASAGNGVAGNGVAGNGVAGNPVAGNGSAGNGSGQGPGTPGRHPAPASPVPTGGALPVGNDPSMN
jgi:TatA/E family protein of Tat protein translocase